MYLILCLVGPSRVAGISGLECAVYSFDFRFIFSFSISCEARCQKGALAVAVKSSQKGALAARASPS